MQRKPSKVPSSMPTLVHVARLAGVGLGTASRALSGEGPVSEETLAKVRLAAERLGYQRNELARSLKVKRSGAVGLVIPDIGGRFMATCVRAIQKVLRQAEYTSIIAFTDGDEKIEAAEIDYLIRHQVDGLIIVPSAGDALHFHSPKLAHTPLVAFDKPIGSDQYDAVLVKNRHSSREAVQHLIDHGHKRIGCLGVNRDHYSIRQRIEGYRAAMNAAKLPQMLGIVDPTGEEIGQQLDHWLALKHSPTAIFSLNEFTTRETIKALSERDISMPKPIAFIGFDDIELGPYLNPPLTAVVQPAEEMGCRAAERLLEKIASQDKLPQKRLMLEAQLVIRGSCGCPSVRKGTLFR